MKINMIRSDRSLPRDARAPFRKEKVAFELKY